MGQKVHPIGFRLGFIKDWNAHWYAQGKQYARKVKEDLEIRKLVEKEFKRAGISRVVIDRAGNKVSVNLYVARPSIVIGRKGATVEAFRKKLAELLPGQEVRVNVREVRVPEVDAQLVAQNIAERIEQRVSHRRAMKRAVEMAMRMGVEGIRVQCKGRLGGAEIARKEGYIRGRVPLQTMRVDIDYGFAVALTKYGTIGVKVWINKGEVLERPTFGEE